MASFYFQFLSAFILLRGIQGSQLVPPTSFSVIGDNNNQNHKMVDMGVLLNRLDQLEAKVKQHEVKINSQQTEINQLKKKTSDLEEKNHQLVLKASTKEDDAASRGSSLPRSCFEIKATNPSAQSGVYSIDPDGRIGGDPPIKVYCDMATQTTSVYHDTEAKTNVTACLDPGCYTKAITYNATMRQLSMLADISASCKQLIRFDSTGVPLEHKNANYGYWNDRNGRKQIFWAGPATSQHTCQCGITNNCVERTSKCNVDSLAPTELFDEGFVTATELLPITRLSFGRTSLTGVKASYTLGRFKCNGQAAIPSKPTNCLDLFKMGHTLSGFYDVKGSSSQISTVYCDFTKSWTETGYETRYGFIDVKSSAVHFFVTRITNWSTSGTIPFEKEHLNLGGGMNLASGVFTAPKTGIYAFSFKGNGVDSDSDYAGYAYVFLQRNGADVADGYSRINGATSGTQSTLSVHSTLKLNKGDMITIRHEGGEIYSDSNGDIQFTGSLLEEDHIIS